MTNQLSMSRISLAILILIITIGVIEYRKYRETQPARTNASDRALVRANTQAQLILTETFCGGADANCDCNGNETV